MGEKPMKIALTGLQWTLGIVILIEAIQFVLPGARHSFAQTHMPGALRFVLGWGEIAGCVLMLIPQTATRGAWLLLAAFGLAILIHVVHGMYNVSSLLIYMAAAWTVAVANKS